MGMFLRDLRYGFRILVKNPGFSIIVIICLALGIGACISIFSIIYGYVLRPLPFPDPDQITMVWETFRPREIQTGQVSYPNLEEWRTRNHVFEEIGAFHPAQYTLTGVELPERLAGALVDAEFFTTLGIEASRGRLFTSEDCQPGAQNVVILSNGFWRRQFGADERVIGQTVTLDENIFTVIGVLPYDFNFPFAISDAEIWTTTALEPFAFDHREYPMFLAIGRLKDRIKLRDAQAEMNAIALQLEEEYPDTNREHGFNLVPLHRQVTGRIRPLLYILFGATVMVLLIACTNVANMLLARSSRRRSGMAIRAAMGAGRYRLIGQLLTESVLMSLIGGGLGVLLATWGVDAVVVLIPPAISYSPAIGINIPVLIFTLFISVATGLLFGAAPALQSSRVCLSTALNDVRGITSTGGPYRLRHGLVVVETALALVLLIGAGLLIRSFDQMMDTDPGFDPEKVLTFQMSRDWSDYHVEYRADFYLEASERLASLPGIVSAAAGTAMPLSYGFRAPFLIEGQPEPGLGEKPTCRYLSVTPTYFEALEIPLIHGRIFTNADRRDQPGVIIINRAAAEAFWPDEDPIGKRIIPDVDITEFDPTTYEVIGIVADVKDIRLDVESSTCIYVPCTQQTWPNMTFALRTEGDPMTVAQAVRNELSEMTDEATFGFAPLAWTLDRSIIQRRFPMVLLSIFAALALILAAAGIYGMLSYTVVLKTHEIGIRMALGSQPGGILRMILKQGIMLVVTGVVIGALVTLAASRVLKSMLYGISTTDPITFTCVSLLLIGVASIACYLPTRRATKIDPAITLRYE